MPKKSLPFENPFKIEHGNTSVPVKYCLFLGSYIPEVIAEYVSLYSLHQGIAKSRVVEDAIKVFYQTKRLTSENLITDLAQRALREWETCLEKGRLQPDFPQITFQQYLGKLKTILRKRGLSPATANKVIKEIENEKV